MVNFVSSFENLVPEVVAFVVKNFDMDHATVNLNTNMSPLSGYYCIQSRYAFFHIIPTISMSQLNIVHFLFSSSLSLKLGDKI